MYDLLLLPNYIDPSAIHERIGPNDPLHRPELFDELPQLPAGVQLKPLINVQKQRFIAGCVRHLLLPRYTSLMFDLIKSGLSNRLRKDNC